MTLPRPARVLAAFAVASTLTACSAEPPPGQPPENDASTNTGAPATTTPATTAATDRASSTRDSAQRSAGTGGKRAAGHGASVRTPNSAAQTTTAGHPGPSCVKDAASDLDSAGTPPRYADILGACIRDAGTAVRLELRLAGDVPARMPDRDTNLTFGFELRRGSGAESYVFAESDHGGWTAYITRGHGRRALSKAISINGRDLRLTMSRSELDGAKQLEWKVESSWLSSGLLKTSYAFDTAPDRGHASFRRSAS